MSLSPFRRFLCHSPAIKTLVGARVGAIATGAAVATSGHIHLIITLLEVDTGCRETSGGSADLSGSIEAMDDRSGTLEFAEDAAYLRGCLPPGEVGRVAIEVTWLGDSRYVAVNLDFGNGWLAVSILNMALCVSTSLGCLIVLRFGFQGGDNSSVSMENFVMVDLSV